LLRNVPSQHARRFGTRLAPLPEIDAPMKVLCAQCLREGLADSDHSSDSRAMCERHGVSLGSALAEQSFPGVRLLVVVAAGERILFDYLRRVCAGLNDVGIIIERRQGDRRSAALTVDEDRRLQQDRRQRLSEAPEPWYRYIRFGGGWTEEHSRELAP